ncbi:FkbM family methyltransferase [bacterium]|nr:FkbM family methyltransferase [Candidatus Elulimicrobium humile]
MLIPYSECIAINKQSFNNIVHIGAHHGEEIEDYIKFGVKKIYWFEANKLMMKHLFDNTNRYPIEQHYFCEVLSDANDEEVEFKITNNGQSSSILELGTHQSHYPHITVTETRKLKTKRFDTLVAQKNIDIMSVDFINLDIQGAELKALKGFGDILKTSNIKAIYSEVNFEQLYVGAALIQEIDQYLSLYDFTRVITVNTPYNWGDALYLRK